MDRLTINLAEITRQEVQAYVGNTHDAQMVAVLDDPNQIYTVVIVPKNAEERPAWVAVMARVVGDTIVIDEDTSIDKPLVDALMVNGSIPRDRIVLAYKGEKLAD
jgi:transposase-like protein